MDEKRFDDLLRALAQPESRRKALKTMAAGLFGAAGLAAALDAEAKGKAGKHGGNGKHGGKGKHGGNGKQHHGQGGASGRSSAVSCSGSGCVNYTGQGWSADGSLNSEYCCKPTGGTCTPTALVDCSTAGSEPCDLSYLLFVFTGKGVTNVQITGPWGTAPMTDDNGGWKYATTAYYSLQQLLDAGVYVTFDGTPTNANPQLTVSHGCPGAKQCIPSLTCADYPNQCGTGLSNGCANTLDCGCDTTCGGKGTGAYACSSNEPGIPGTCVCTPVETCPALGVEQGSACSGLDNACCGTYGCDCKKTCPNGGANNACGKDGTCTCDAVTAETGCPADGIPVNGQCSGLDDKCCGTYACNCSKTCGNGGAPNNDCSGGTCACTKSSCPSGGVAQGKPCKGLDDGCCGTQNCACSVSCADGTKSNAYCDQTSGTCACTKIDKAVACKGKCGQTVSDGCCGTYQCPDCCNSCTIGYYKQNQCGTPKGANWGSQITVSGQTAVLKPDTSLSLICPSPADKTVAQYCSKYGTLGNALKQTGSEVICAQFAAALINQNLTKGDYPDCFDLNTISLCTLAKDSKANATLTYYNQGGDQGYEICPNRGCGTA